MTTLAATAGSLCRGSVNHEHRAHEVFGDEKALWWRRAVIAYPDYADYQRKRGTRS